MSETENEATLSLPPEITIIDTERSEINRAEGKVPEPENGPDIVATEKENEKHPEKKQKASAHAKPKQYNLGDYL